MAGCKQTKCMEATWRAGKQQIASKPTSTPGRVAVVVQAVHEDLLRILGVLAGRVAGGRAASAQGPRQRGAHVDVLVPWRQGLALQRKH